MPQVGDPAPVPEQMFGDPEVDVSGLYIPTEDYIVIGLAQNTRYPPDGRIIPDIDVTFRVPGLPGTFIRRIDNYAFTHADVLEYMRDRALTIRRIFALPGEYVEGASAGQVVLD